MRQGVTANLCLGTSVAIQARMGDFFARLIGRRDVVKRRYRTPLWAWAQELIGANQAGFQRVANGNPTLV